LPRVGFKKLPDALSQDGSNGILASRTIISAGGSLSCTTQFPEFGDHFFLVLIG
jgi:hypothetical protein